MRKWHIKITAALLAAAMVVSNSAVIPVWAQSDVSVQEVTEASPDETQIAETESTTIEETVEAAIPETETVITTETVVENAEETQPVILPEEEISDEPLPLEEEEQTDDVSAYPVRIENTGYNSLNEAIDAASSGAVIVLQQDVEVTQCLVITKNLTIASDGEVRVIKRGADYSGRLFEINNSVTLKIGSGAQSGNVIVDGGANWVKDVEIPDSTQPGGIRIETQPAQSPVEEDAYNNGLRASGSLVWINRGTLQIAADAVFQNNDLSGSGGGAVGTGAGGSSRIDVYGTIKNNHTNKNGGAITTNGYLNIYNSAKMIGNLSDINAGAVDNWGGGVVTIQGGTFTGNGAQYGGVIWTDGKVDIQAGVFSENKASKAGGAFYASSSNDSRSPLFYGGSFTENQAPSGADVYQATQNAKYKGSIVIDDLFVKNSQFIKVTGALSGNIGVSYENDPTDRGTVIAKGDGYTLTAAAAEHFSSVSEYYSVSFADSSIMLVYAPVVIDEQPQDCPELELNHQTELKISAHSVAETDVSYQWYQSSDREGNDGKLIEGAVENVYTFEGTSVGTYYFYCVVTAPRATENKSQVISVKVVDKNSAELPVITEQPTDGTYDLHSEARLTVQAEVSDGGTLSYQWYRAAGADDRDGELIDGATEAELIADTSSSGQFYYYCVVTNTNENVENKTAQTISRTALVTVTEAAVKYNDVAYSSLDDALVRMDTAADGKLEILKDVTLSRTLTIKGGNISVEAAEGIQPVIKLTTVHTGEAFIVASGTLTLKNVIVDGGAVWTGQNHSVMNRGTNNRGRSVNSPLITMKGGTVNLEEGTILQNNVANWTSSCVVMTAGTLNINGAWLQDCYGGSHGGVIYASSSNSTINMTGGKVVRNQARSSTGGICADTGTTFNYSGGEIAYNYTVGRAGGVFVNGVLNISGEANIHDNYAGGNGGGVLHLAGNFTLAGGNIRNNTANANGGGIASLGGTLEISDGIVSDNTAASQGNGIFLESGVSVRNDHIPDTVTDDVYSAKTVTLTLDGNGSSQTSKQTVHYLGIYDLPDFERNGYKFLGWFTQAEGGEQIQSGDRITLKSNTSLYAHWELTATNVITIEEQPQSGAYYIEDDPHLTVKASAASGELNYTWYQCDDEAGTNPVVVGTDSSSLALPSSVDDMGSYYYYCKVEAQDKNAEDVLTEIVHVEMISHNHASVPVFTRQPEGGEIFVNGELEISAQAQVNDGGTVTYQWYKSEDTEFEHAQPVEGGRESTYVIHPDQAGTFYYFVKAINTKNTDSGKEVTAEIISSLAKIICHNEITVEQLGSGSPLLGQDYWKLYRVGTSQDDYGYIKNAASKYGSYGSNTIERAFDGNFNTFWETNRGGVNNQVAMQFDQPVKLDRIVYFTRQDYLKGRGYPTKMTIFSKNGEEAYSEVGVAKSKESGGYILFTLPETITTTALIFEFTESTYGNWASAGEFILLRDESTVLTGDVQIHGNAVPGDKLTADASVTESLEISEKSLAYQWQSSEDGELYTNIEGADKKTYTVSESDVNKYLRVVVSDGDKNFTGSLVSEPYKGLFEVTLEGNMVIGGTVKPVMTYMTGDPVSYVYQWQRSTQQGEFTDIDGAVNESYTITPADAGHEIRAAVSVENSGKTFTSYSNTVIADVAAVMTGAPQVNSTLTASLSGVAKDRELELAYQWQISDDESDESFEDITDGTNVSYTIGEDLLNKYIRVKVSVKESQKTYISEAWKILEEGTIQICDGDFIYLSDVSAENLLKKDVGFGVFQLDKNTSGNRISLMVDGTKNYFMKGLGAHAPATIIYKVSDYVKYYHYERFIAYLGLDSAQGNNGDGVRFTVSTSEDNSNYTAVETTGVLKGTSNAVYVDIDLTGVNYIKIAISSNGNASSDHSVVADAKLAAKDYKDQSEENSLFKTVEEYDKEIKAYEEEHSGQSHAQMLDDEVYRKFIYQRSFVKAADYQMLKAYLYDESYVKTLDWFLNDMEALDLYTGGGAPEGSYANFVEVLKNLYISRGSDMNGANGSLYKKMIITMALTHSATVTYWADSSMKSDAVRRYDIYKKLYENGLLINDVFAGLKVEEMRWVFNNISADEEIEWLNYYVRNHTNKKNQTEWTLNNFTPGPYYFITYTMGFNYYQPRFYSEENKASWQQKYYLTNEIAQSDVYDINITYANNHPRLWIVWEAGAVCGGISKTGTNLLTAFGVPGVVIGQPGHAAYFQYFQTADGKGKWEIYNDVSGWTLSEKGERMLNGWGNSNWDSAYQGSYVLLAQAALNEGDKYFTSQELVKIADVYRDDPEKQIQIYEEALSVLDLNMDAWLGMINAYKAAGKSESEFLDLASRISKALTYYPLPMRDILTNLIRPNISSETGKAVVSIYVQSALRAASAATTANTLQPNHCKTMANYLLGYSDYQVASFSFDGDKAGTVVLSSSFSGGNELLISIDAGENWINAGTVSEYKFTKEQLEAITAENDIRVRFQGTESYYTIDITQSSKPSNLYNNDRENRITGNIAGLEWMADGDTHGEWKNLTDQTFFEGNQTILVRKKASKTAAASGSLSFSFTQDKVDATRQYIPLGSVNFVNCSSAETGKNGSAEHILDGNIYTIWHTYWNGSDTQRYITVSFDSPRYLTSIDYTPNRNAGNGTFQNVEVYTSMDGESWMLSGTASGWANNADKKTLDLFAPVYTSYVMIKVTKGVGGFASGAMLEFFEDTTVKDKTVERLELQSEPVKTTYVVGDVLNTAGLNVTAYYDDGTHSTINNELLKFTPEVFRTTGTQTVEAAYRMDGNVAPVTFEVTVGENTKTAERIEVAEHPVKTRYFVGDTLETEGLLVKAYYTDGSWGYIFEDQYTLSPTVFEQDGKTVPITVSYTQGENVFTDEFDVEVTKQVQSVEITKTPEKDSYNLGDTMDPSGMEVTLVFTDGMKEVIDDTEYSVLSDGFSDTSGNKTVEIVYNRKPEIKTSVTVVVYPYITSGYLQLESHEGENTAYVSGVAEIGIPEDGNIIIPSSVTAAGRLEFTVDTVGAGAFSDQLGIVSATLPKTVTRVDSGAFEGCSNFKELYLTDYESFADFSIADDAFGAVDGDDVIAGIIYVANQTLAEELAGKNLKGIKNFEIISVTEKITELQVTAPEKTDYNLGEELDLNGFSVRGVLKNDHSVELTSNMYTIHGFDSTRAGEQTITVEGVQMDLRAEFMVRVTPAVPVIAVQPKNAVYDISEFPEPLTVEASISDAGNLSYQWYVSDNGEDFEKLSSETGASCAVTPEKTRYYYVEVYNNDSEGAQETAVKVQSDTVKIEFGSYEARVGNTPYGTLAEAIGAADTGETVTLVKNVVLKETLTINKNITLTGYGIYREQTYINNALINVTGGKVTLKNIVVDGGAVWSGAVDAVLNRGIANSGTNEVTGQPGIDVKETLVIVSGGELVLDEGASLQNNCNTSGIYGKSGGAVRINGSSVLRIRGGQIINNYGNPYGGAVLSLNNASILLEYGRVAGNHASSSGGTFCVDNSSSITMPENEDESKIMVVENNRTSGDGGVIWLAGGKALLSGGVIRNNRGNNGGAVHIYNGGTVELGNVIITGNQANRGPGINYSSGSVAITGVPHITDAIYLASGKLLTIKSDLSGLDTKIPVAVQSYSASGGQIASASPRELAQAAVNAFFVIGGELPLYAYNGGVYYGTPTTITITEDLPESVEIMAGRQLKLSIEALVEPADTAQPVYKWYRCSDANGNGATLITTSDSPEPNILSLGDCSEGVCYFYCEVSASNEKADPVRSTICTVTVTKFVPASKAIEKLNTLP